MQPLFDYNLRQFLTRCFTKPYNSAQFDRLLRF